MKIIQKVEPRAPKMEWRFKCGHCRSTLEVRASDLVRYFDEDPRDHDQHVVFKCPACEKYNDVIDHVAPEVRRELEVDSWEDVCRTEPPCTAELVVTRMVEKSLERRKRE